MIKFENMARGEIIFSHKDEKTGSVSHFNVTRLQNSILYSLRPTVNIPVDANYAKFCVENRGIEKHRLVPLIGKTIKIPISVLIWDGGTHLIVDGHHRYVASALNGMESVPGRMIPKGIWEKFVVIGVPEVNMDLVVKSFSGIEACK